MVDEEILDEIEQVSRREYRRKKQKELQPIVDTLFEKIKVVVFNTVECNKMSSKSDSAKLDSDDYELEMEKDGLNIEISLKLSEKYYKE